MATQQEKAERQLTKASEEKQNLLKSVEALKVQLANGPVTMDLQAAFDAVAAQAQAVCACESP